VVVPFPQVQVVATSSFHTTNNHRNTGGSMGTVTPSVLVVKGKLGTALTAASLLAAPFTGGASLAAGAAARGAMVGVQGGKALLAERKAAQAGKGLQSAQAGRTAALTNRPPTIPPPKTTPRDSRGQFYGHKTRTAGSRADIDAGRATDLSEHGVTPSAPADVSANINSSSMGTDTMNSTSNVGVTPSSPPTPTDSNFHTFDVDNVKQTDGSVANQQGSFSHQQNVDVHQQNIDTAQAQSDKMSEKLLDAQKDYDDSQKTNTPIGAASVAGAYGFNQLEQHKQQNQAKQQAEMKRIEDLSSAGRAKASTGTGGQVAVT